MTEMWVKFDRVGRNHNVPQLAINVEAATTQVIDGETGKVTSEISWDNVAGQIEDSIRRYVMSSDPQVLIYERDNGQKHGTIIVGGIRNAGTFEIEETK